MQDAALSFLSFFIATSFGNFFDTVLKALQNSNTIKNVLHPSSTSDARKMMHARLLLLRSKALSARTTAPAAALHLASRSSSSSGDGVTIAAASATGRALSSLAYLPKLHASIPEDLTSIQRLVNEYEVRACIVFC